MRRLFASDSLGRSHAILEDHFKHSEHPWLLYSGTTSFRTVARAEPAHRDWSASTMLDGKGRVLHDTRIVIEGSKIVAIDPTAGPVNYDLRGLTVLPGWIDAHVHITWSFGPDGKNAGQGGTTQEAAYAAASNAWLTLMAGFTTIQSVGSPTDVPLRDAIAKGLLPGPRILTAGEPLSGRGEKTGTPNEIRAFVRKQKEAGADLIKIYASGGMTPRRDDDVAGAIERGLR